METMKKRLVIDEINLGKILEDKTKLKKEYPEVVKLLQEVGLSFSVFFRRRSEHTDPYRVETNVFFSEPPPTL